MQHQDDILSIYLCFLTTNPLALLVHFQMEEITTPLLSILTLADDSHRLLSRRMSGQTVPNPPFGFIILPIISGIVSRNQSGSPVHMNDCNSVKLSGIVNRRLYKFTPTSKIGVSSSDYELRKAFQLCTYCFVHIRGADIVLQGAETINKVVYLKINT